MKTLHLTIIIGIIVIMMTSIGIFVEKVGENQQHPYVAITINGIKDNYIVSEPIAFSVTVDGYGSGCGDTYATITNENNSQYKPLGGGSMPQCVANAQLNNFKFSTLSGNTRINHTGNYVLVASFDDSIIHYHTTTKKKFFVMPYQITGIYDTGITPFSVNVTNTNFTVNYNMSGGQISGIKQDTQTKSLVVATQTTSNGTLAINIPRALLD
ncbi:MAG: hypothetical protein ACREA8_06285 [Nitrosotalea sp.]